MPTQQAFEAATLEAALARVQEEVGPTARITQAEKVRTGGIAGFFSRERFEVTVEVADDVDMARSTPDRAGADHRPAPPTPTSLLDLVEEVSARERGGPSPVVHPSVEATPTSDGAEGTLDATGPSTTGKMFREVLQGIAAEAGLILPDTPSEDGFEDAEMPTAEDEPDRHGPDPVGEAEAPLTYGPGAPPRQVHRAQHDEPHDDRFPVTSETLAALGIPRTLLGDGSGRTTPAQRILTATEQAPAPPPLVARRGDVIVVVGDEQVAMEAAAVAAAQLGQSSDDVVVAGTDRTGFNTIASPDDARTRISLWRRCGVPFVVAVCAPQGAAGAEWAREMTAALEPVAVWAAVRADRKAEDVVLLSERLGGVDALAVGACSETVSPAAVLGAGIPVAVLEGRRASAAAWTALLVERLTP